MFHSHFTTNTHSTILSHYFCIKHLMIEVLSQNIGLIFKIDFVALREIFVQHMESGTLIFFLFNENNYIFLLFADENLLTFVTTRNEHFFWIKECGRLQLWLKMNWSVFQFSFWNENRSIFSYQYKLSAHLCMKYWIIENAKKSSVNSVSMALHLFDLFNENRQQLQNRIN